MNKKKVVLLTNIPSPYRVLQFDLLSEMLDRDFLVVYYRPIESNRDWSIPKLKHDSIFLRKSLFSRVNFYPQIFTLLIKSSPSVIIITGFTPTIILSVLYAKLFKRKIIVFTDSWLHPVGEMKLFQRLIRKKLIPTADASVCVGNKGLDYLSKYGAEKHSIFISPLAIDNLYYKLYYKPVSKRNYDFIISGQFIQRKMPFFAIDVINAIKNKGYDVKLLLIGSGPLETMIINKLKQYNIEFYFPGFIQQDKLPLHYADSKVLLFPSECDPWGIVANEACAVGTPVITCENTGVSNDLIIHNYNGFVLPLIVEVWADYAIKLLKDDILQERFSANSLHQISNYSIKNAASGLKHAVDYVIDDFIN